MTFDQQLPDITLTHKKYTLIGQKYKVFSNIIISCVTASKTNIWQQHEGIPCPVGVLYKHHLQLYRWDWVWNLWIKCWLKTCSVRLNQSQVMPPSDTFRITSSCNWNTVVFWCFVHSSGSLSVSTRDLSPAYVTKICLRKELQLDEWAVTKTFCECGAWCCIYLL